MRTKERSFHREVARMGRAPGALGVGTETHRHSECSMGTKNSQLPHWLIVSVEKDSHGNQDITAVSLAESTEVCSEAGPLQEGLEDKRGTGMRATAGPALAVDRKGSRTLPCMSA